MPIYEYRCQDCRRRTSVFLRSFASPVPATVTCSHCGSSATERVFSLFAVVRSEESRLEAIANMRHWGEMSADDPRNLARLMREIEREAGESMGPEFEEMVERLEAGERPEDWAAEEETSEPFSSTESEPEP
jgi:putative FmdB family regulatory protein